MAAQNLDDVFIRQLTVGAVTLPAACVGDAQVKAGAKIDPTKQRSRLYLHFSQKSGSINVSTRQGLGVIHGTTGSVVALYARNIVAATGTDNTSIQIKKNGLNILLAPLVLNTAADYNTQSTAGFSDATLVAGDQLDVDITVTGGSPGQGQDVTLVIDVDPQ